MSAANSNTSRPASQPRDQLVLKVENVPLAGRLLTIEIFEVQNPVHTKSTVTPSSPVRSAPSTPSASSNSARADGFRVAARDDVENEYSLFVTRQKAEYLYRAAYSAEAEASEMITLEAMANGILSHLSIIGNRQRDVGKLVCREPEPHVEKKTRMLPTSTPPNKQRNPHLLSKRQDQRAVRVLKTSKRTMEAVAAAMLRSVMNGTDDSEVESGKLDRKGSEASILHRMAVADSKTMWKAQLETNYEESCHPSLYDSDASAATQEFTLAPGLSSVKRALPERKTKHKDLEERRQKGRQQRILIAQVAHEAPNSMLDSIHGQDSYQVLTEEREQESDSLSPAASRRTSMITVGSTEKPSPQPRASSAPRSSVGNVYSLRNLFDLNTPEPEQFLRRRTLDTHRSVLGKDRWQDDIPGMEIEITDERPTIETPPNKLDALLNTARRVMVVNAVGGTLQRGNIDTSRLIPERRRGRTSTSPNIKSTSEKMDQPSSPGITALTQKQPFDEPVRQEDIPPPTHSSFSRLRPRSNSLGCERAVRSAPLPSATSKAPIQEFLSPAEPEKPPRVSEVTQEKESSVAPSDPEVVVYSPNEEIDTNSEENTTERVDELLRAHTFRAMDDTATIENVLLSPVAGDVNLVMDTEPQMHIPDPVQMTSPLPYQHDDFSGTDRPECWEGQSLSAMYIDAPDKAVERISSKEMEVEQSQSGVEDEAHEQQQSLAREDAYSAVPDPAAQVQVKDDVLEQESYIHLQVATNVAIPDNPSPLQEELTMDHPEHEKSIDISRRKSVNPRKKSGVTNAGQVNRRISVARMADPQVMVDRLPPKLERRRTEDEVKKCGLPRRMSTLDPNSPLPGISPTHVVKTSKASADNSPDQAHRANNKRLTLSKAGVVQSATNYHKKWGKWMAGKNIIEKVGCLQLEELVLADSQNEENLLKLGYRYARSSETSTSAISLLENAALLHKNATRTREYWFWLGSAHLDIFMRHRKYLPIARFHLCKSLRAFTSAFAYLDSLVDPILLLRYAIVLFWHKGDGNLEKTRDIFHELFSQFATFCDKDRPNVLFLQFQVLHRLKLYVDAIECMNKLITLHESTKRQSGALLPSTTTTPAYDAAEYRLMLMQCQQASGDYVLAAQSLASVLKEKNDHHHATLKDEEFFDLWFSLAEKCFQHEDYTLAVEYYAIALNFAKQSQALAAIHYNLGLCFQSLGEDNKCVTEYKRARTANRHVPPLVSLTELNASYDERYVQLLQKTVVQTIEEVRVELYGKAVRRLQRVFRRSRRNLNVKPDNSNAEAQVTKMPSLSKRKESIVATRKLSVPVKVEGTSDKTEVKKEENLTQKVVALDDNQASKHEENALEGVENRHESFLARKQVAMEEMAELLSNPQYRGREASPSSRSNARLRATTQLRSGLLSPEKDRLDARRKQSMETFHQLGYVSSTMPWIEFWEKLLALAPELFESRHALYGSIARIRGRRPLVTDEVAFCALAESIGNVHEAVEKLHDASYERELTYVCAVIEVAKLLERDFPLQSMQLSLKSPHVSLPTISSPTADTIAGQSSHSPTGIGTSRRVVLPPTRVTSAATSKPKKHIRMNQMVDLHFQEHVQKQEAVKAIAEATGGFVHAHQRTEKLLVLQHFRQANNALVSSQLAFGSGKAGI